MTLVAGLDAIALPVFDEEGDRIDRKKILPIRVMPYAGVFWSSGRSSATIAPSTGQT
jgi:hypothetical protein